MATFEISDYETAEQIRDLVYAGMTGETVSLTINEDGVLNIVRDGGEYGTLNTFEAMPEVVREEVAKGADFLDGRLRNWAGSIDFDTFNIDSPSACVLGQVFGPAVEHLPHGAWDTGYDFGTRVLFGAWADTSGYGFSLGAFGSAEQYKKAWQAEVAKRI